MKIQTDHIGDNAYNFSVTGLGEIDAVEIGELTEELRTVDLPDGTRASGGKTNPVEFELSVPAHHNLTVAKMEAWYQEGKDPVSPGYKKPGVLTLKRMSGSNGRQYSCLGIFVTGRGIPGSKLEGDGAMQVLKYPMSVDQVLPFG
jgi:hypothetical protein